MRVSFQAFDRSKAWHVAGQQLAHLRGWSPFVADRIQPDRANRRAGGVVRSIDAALRVPENAPHPYYWQAHPDFAASLLPCFAIRYGRPICLPPWRIWRGFSQPAEAFTPELSTGRSLFALSGIINPLFATYEKCRLSGDSSRFGTTQTTPQRGAAVSSPVTNHRPYWALGGRQSRINQTDAVTLFIFSY